MTTNKKNKETIKNEEPNLHICDGEVVAAQPSGDSEAPPKTELASALSDLAKMELPCSPNDTGPGVTPPKYGGSVRDLIKWADGLTIAQMHKRADDYDRHS